MTVPKMKKIKKTVPEKSKGKALKGEKKTNSVTPKAGVINNFVKNFVRYLKKKEFPNSDLMLELMMIRVKNLKTIEEIIAKPELKSYFLNFIKT